MAPDPIARSAPAYTVRAATRDDIDTLVAFTSSEALDAERRNSNDRALRAYKRAAFAEAPSLILTKSLAEK